MTEDQLHDLFREIRDEPVPADSRVRVRQALAERIAAGRWMESVRRHWKIAAMVLAGSALALIFALRTTLVDRKAVPPVAAHQTAAPEAPPRQSPVAADVKPRGVDHAPLTAVRKMRSRAQPVANRMPRREQVSAPYDAAPSEVTPAGVGAGASVVRIETSDPDVVILLIGA